MRYDVPNEKGITRRERNDRVEEFSPVFKVPLHGVYLWQWYKSISDTLPRIRDGVCNPIPPTEFKAWLELSGIICYPFEYEILSAMDVVYVDEMNKELQDYRERRDEELKREAERKK